MERVKTPLKIILISCIILFIGCSDSSNREDSSQANNSTVIKESKIITMKHINS